MISRGQTLSLPAMLSRTTRILSQPAKQRIRPDLPWEYGFAKYLGRKLTPAERAVIRPIEKARKIFRPRPFLVIDPPGTDSSELLRQLQRYYLSVMNDSYGIIIQPCGEKSRRDKRIIPISPRCGDHARGLSSGFTLMLNVERYRAFSPFYGRDSRWDDLYCALYPQLSPCGILIIHTAMPVGRRLRKYSFWLSRLTNLFHIRAEAQPSLRAEALMSGDLPVVIAIDTSPPAVAPPPDRPPDFPPSMICT